MTGGVCLRIRQPWNGEAAIRRRYDAHVMPNGYPKRQVRRMTSRHPSGTLSKPEHPTMSSSYFVNKLVSASWFQLHIHRCGQWEGKRIRFNLESAVTGHRSALSLHIQEANGA